MTYKENPEITRARILIHSHLCEALVLVEDYERISGLRFAVTRESASLLKTRAAGHYKAAKCLLAAFPDCKGTGSLDFDALKAFFAKRTR